MEDEGRIGTELTFEGSKPIERLDFALFTEAAQRGGKDAEPIKRQRRSGPPARRSRQQSLGTTTKDSSSTNSPSPTFTTRARSRAETEALRMPNLHLTKEQVLAPHHLPDGQRGDFPARAAINTSPATRATTFRKAGGSSRNTTAWDATSSSPASRTILMGLQAISGRAGAVASEASDRRRARRSRMAAQVPLESRA